MGKKTVIKLLTKKCKWLIMVGMKKGSAAKRNRQNQKRRIRNKMTQGAARTMLKKARAFVVAGDSENALRSGNLFASLIDKAVARGGVHKNTANRLKSRLTKSINALNAKKS